MTEELKNKLKENGVDLNATMARFMGMEAMYKKFLFRFTDDPNYGELKKCMESGDVDKAYVAAHTLKGVAGNLGLGDLYASSAALADVLRQRGSRTEELFAKVTDNYHQICEVIAAHKADA